jgi:hypothetical protein
MGTEDDDAGYVVCYADEAGLLDAAPAFLSSLPNATVCHLATLGSVSNWRLAQTTRANAELIADACRSDGGDGAVYIANGIRPDVLRFAARNPMVQFEYVEDGLDAYLPHSVARADLTDRRFFRHVSKRLLGFQRPESWDMQTALPYQHFHFLRPDLARTEIPDSRLSQISPKAFVSSVSRFARHVTGSMPSRPATDIYFIRNTESVPDQNRYLDDVRRWSETVSAAGEERVAGIKPHPREADQRFLRRLSNEGITLYPHWVPGELLVPFLDEKCRMYSGLSTFILTSKILLPQRSILLERSIDARWLAILQQWDDNISVLEPDDQL